MIDSDDNGTSQELTEESAAELPFFAKLLSDEEDPQPSKEPPTQESPESESEPEASTEQADPDKPEDQEAAEATDEQPEVLYPVKINGVEEMVTLDELRKGYSRTKDYTQKTQDIAEQRRRLEAEIPAVRAEREKTAALLQQLEQAVTEATPQEPDWARLQQEEPDKFAETYAAWRLRQDQLGAIRQEREKAEYAVLQDHQQLQQRYIEDQKTKLIEAIPEWKNAETAKSEKSKLVAIAKEVGYSEQELQEVMDHRAIVLLRDAMKYRELKKKQPDIKSRIEKIKTATPGSATGTSTVPKTAAERALARLEKTGRQEDAAAALLAKFDL